MMIHCCQPACKPLTHAAILCGSSRTINNEISKILLYEATRSLWLFTSLLFSFESVERLNDTSIELI